MEIISQTVFPDGTEREGVFQSTGRAPQGLACENCSALPRVTGRGEKVFSTHIKTKSNKPVRQMEGVGGFVSAVQLHVHLPPVQNGTRLSK